MSDKGLLHQYINGMPENLRKSMTQLADELADNFRVGTQDRAKNATWYRLTAKTHSTANTEFSFKHGLGFAPGQLFPVLDLSVVNSQMVNLTVTRAADDERIYLSSPSTSATFTVLAE